MKYAERYIIAIVACIITLGALPAYADESNAAKVESNRNERNAIRKGNKLYEEKRYSEAEVEYKRALQYNPQSDVANYNLALSYIKQGGTADPNDEKSPLNQAEQILKNVVKTAANKGLASRAYYNLGNLAFNKQNYQESVEMYKDALRRNPDDDQARDNLRLAQKKLQEQQQNQDKNQDQNKQDQDKQKQDQNQNNDENKDKQDNQQQDQQNQQQKPNQNQPKEQNQGMSEGNAEQILKAMQDAEKGTQQKVNAAKMREDEKNRRRTERQW
ncbi:MAG: tetratricopeptide repeat protein [Muribaculaceae bacterium]